MYQKQSKLFFLFTAVILLICSTFGSVYAEGENSSIGTWKEVSPIPFSPKLPDQTLSIGLAAPAGDNKVLITSNWDDAYVYDTGNNTWKHLANRTMEYGQAAVTLLDGRVFIIGGKEKIIPSQDSYNSQSVRTEIFNPSDNSFRQAASLPESLEWVSAVVLKDGSVLLFGKTFKKENITYTYDVSKNTWSRKAKVGYAGTKTLINNQGNVFSYGPSVLEASISPGEYYDYAEDNFHTSWGMSNPRTAGACTVMADGKFLIVGGSNGGYSDLANWDAEIFDPEQNMWRTTSFMESGRNNSRAVTLPDGRVLVMAGVHGKEYFKTTEVYNPITDTWTKGPSLRYSYSLPHVVQLKNGSIMILGGYDGKGSNRCEMLVLDPSLKAMSLQSYDRIEDAVLTTVGSPHIKVKGTRTILDESNPTASPVFKDGQTMVPLNFFKSGLGAEVNEDKANGTVEVTYGGKTTITASTQVNGVIYAPLRPVAEALGKKITWLKGLIAVADRTVYMDVTSAYRELTVLNRTTLMGITDNARLLKEVPAFSKDGWDYKWYYIRHDNASAFFTDDNGGEGYTNLYLMRENKSEGILEQVYEGISGRILKVEEDIVYLYNFGFLAKMKLGDKYQEYLKSSEPAASSENMNLMWSSFSWDPDSFIKLGDSLADGDWIYFTWDPIDHLNTRRDDPLGYPMRVKYDGSGLQILSRYQMEPNWRGIYGFTQVEDYLYYITNRRLIAGNEEHFTLHRVRVDGSDEKSLAEVMYFDIYKDKIYYRQLGESGQYDSVKFYSINLDGTGNKLLSANGAWEVQYYGDNLYYRVYGDKDGVYTMKTDGSGVRKIGDVQGDLLSADDKYVYYDYNYFDFEANNGQGRFMNMGKYRIDIVTGNKEKAE